MNMKTRCTREQLHEAAVWMTLLRGPDRTAQVDRGFKRWLAAHSDHRFAFETASEAWESVDVLPRGPAPRIGSWERAGFRRGFRHAFVAMAACAVVAVASALAYHGYAGESTAIGEQRILTLEDGTRVVLNTDTRVVVDYDDDRRVVKLKRGEAYFDVAHKGPEWPFVVSVDDRHVNAVGTAFVVRRDPDRLAVTLVEGRVTVLPRRNGPLITLSPGERLTFTPDSAPDIDRPALEPILAWRSGYVDLSGLSLGEAVAEMNRYSRIKLLVTEGKAGIAMSGVFRAGDTESFANAVVDIYGLKLRREARQLTLR